MMKECLNKLMCLQTIKNDDGVSFDFNQCCDDDDKDCVKIQLCTRAMLSKHATMQLSNALVEDDHEDEECMGEVQHGAAQVVNNAIVADQVIAKDAIIGMWLNQTSVTCSCANKDDMGCVASEWNAMIVGDTPANVNISHNDNDDTIATTNNNDNTRISKESSSLSHAATSHGMFSGDDYDDVDCMNETKNNVVTLANEQHDDDDIEEDQIKIEHDENDNLTHVRCPNNHSSDMKNVLQCWNETMIGGSFINPTSQSKQEEEEDTTNFMTQLKNLLAEDDYDDEEYMGETKNEIVMLANKHSDGHNMLACN